MYMNKYRLGSSFLSYSVYYWEGDKKVIVQRFSKSKLGKDYAVALWTKLNST